MPGMRRKLRPIARAVAFLVGGLATLVVMIAIGPAVVRRGIEEDRRIEAPRGIEITETVMLGGIPQVVNIRGQDRANPVLLFLHGGPGTPMLPFAHAFQDAWEAHFTVVHWDQRGAGLTARMTEPEVVADTISFDRMLADTIELSELLRERFGSDRIVLMGHS